MKDLLIVVPQRCRQSLFPAPVHPGGLDFIISCLDDDAGMISQSPDIINRLLSYVIKKLLGAGIHAPGEHEIVPDEDPHLVAELVEVIAFVDASTPDTQHVHVRTA